MGAGAPDKAQTEPDRAKGRANSELADVATRCGFTVKVNRAGHAPKQILGLKKWRKQPFFAMFKRIANICVF